jgi:hypothetical protein
VRFVVDEFYCEYFRFNFHRISIIATYTHFIDLPLRVDYTKILAFDSFVILNISVVFYKKCHSVLEVCGHPLFVTHHRVHEW